MYTCYQEESGNHSYIDHIFVDAKLDSYIVDYGVFENFVNFSDHLPLTCSIQLPFGVHNECHKDPNQNKHHDFVRRWDKGDSPCYYSKSFDFLQKIRIPTEVITCSDCDTFRCTHWQEINEYYNSLIFCTKFCGE